MCSICRKYPCDSRCPNAEIVMVYTCFNCGRAIFSGEECLDLSDYQHGVICSDCLDEMSSSDWMDVIGVGYQIAREDDIYG